MPRRVRPGVAPDPLPREAPLTAACKRSCCWSPYGHVIDVPGCTCHPKEKK